MGALRFIFGGGGWIIWHGLMLLAVILPQLLNRKELLDWTLRKTGEPAAAMAVFAGHFGFRSLPIILFTVVNGLIFAGLARGSFVTRGLLVFNLTAVLAVLCALLATAVAGRSFAALIAGHATVAAALLLNLWMLWCVRERDAATPPIIAGRGLTISLSVLPGLLIAALVGCWGILKWDAARDEAAAKAGVGGVDRARSLVAKYVSDHWHNTARSLDAQNRWVGLYGLVIDYDEQRDVLVASADIHSSIKDEDFEIVAEGINDPAIGGRYDHRGSSFVIDPDSRTIRMIREVPVRGMSGRSYSALMDDFWQAVQFWRDGYVQRIIAIHRGTMTPPVQPLTLEQERELIRERQSK